MFQAVVHKLVLVGSPDQTVCRNLRAAVWVCSGFVSCAAAVAESQSSSPSSSFTTELFLLVITKNRSPTLAAGASMDHSLKPVCRQDKHFLLDTKPLSVCQRNRVVLWIKSKQTSRGQNFFFTFFISLRIVAKIQIKKMH